MKNGHSYVLILLCILFIPHHSKANCTELLSRQSKSGVVYQMTPFTEVNEDSQNPAVYGLRVERVIRSMGWSRKLPAHQAASYSPNENFGKKWLALVGNHHYFIRPFSGEVAGQDRYSRLKIQQYSEEKPPVFFRNPFLDDHFSIIDRGTTTKLLGVSRDGKKLVFYELKSDRDGKLSLKKLSQSESFQDFWMGEGEADYEGVVPFFQMVSKARAERFPVVIAKKLKQPRPPSDVRHRSSGELDHVVYTVAFEGNRIHLKSVFDNLGLVREDTIVAAQVVQIQKVPHLVSVVERAGVENQGVSVSIVNIETGSQEKFSVQLMGGFAGFNAYSLAEHNRIRIALRHRPVDAFSEVKVSGVDVSWQD